MRDLNERDLRILRLSYEQRVLRADLLERYLFRGLTERAARKSIARLEKLNLIKRTNFVTLGGRRLILLTRNGKSMIESQLDYQIPQGRKVDFTTLQHDSFVTAVRLRLEELWEGKWIPEAVLKSQEFPQIPDGLWVFPDQKTMAIEVENSPKGDARFHQIQERWRGSRVRLVLYVSTTPSMERIVRRYLETGPKDLPFGLVRLDELERGTPPVWTVLGQVPLFTQRRLP